jgi:membrane protein
MGKRNRALDFVQTLINRFNEDRVFDLASQLAYTFLFSLFPFLIFIFSLLPYIGLTPENALNFIHQYAPPELDTIIHANIQHVLEKNGGLLSFGVIATIWPMASAIMAIKNVLNRAYGVEENRSFFKAWGMAFIFTFATIFIIIIALILNVFGPMIGRFIFGLLGIPLSLFHLWTLFRLFLSLVVIVIIIACLYFVLPNKLLHFKDVYIGALIAAIAWQMTSLLFSFYIERFANYTMMYGTLAGVVITMTWFYITGFILVMGGEINAVIHRRFHPK